MSGGQAIVLLGHEPGRPDLGNGYRVTPGVVPTATPTPTPIPLSACPKGPADRFMAEVHYADVVVTLQAPLALMDQSGAPYGAFDDETALERVIAGLRVRRAGE